MHMRIDQSRRNGEVDAPNKAERPLSDLEDLYEETLRDFQEGSVVEGTVLDLEKGYALVDIGYKAEGKVPLAEFTDADGNLTVKVGDPVEVLLIQREDEEGRPVISRQKAVRAKVWESVGKAHETGSTIRGKIVSRVKGGFLVEIGTRAFLPGSNLDLGWVSDADKWIGEECDFKVLQYDKRRGNIILSRKAVLEEEREKQKVKILARMEKGLVVDGVVKNITDYGLFVDIGGLDGLVHISNISWSKIKHPSQAFQIGDEVKVKVLDFDLEKERVSLGIKQLEPNPWDHIKDHYPVGTVIEGKIKNITAFGLFIGIDEGIDGLVHISDISWTRSLKHPSEVYKKGDVVQAVILEIDRKNERVSLGIKQLTPDPWVGVSGKSPPGKHVPGKVTNVTSFGLFVELEDGVEGLVHISETPQKKQMDLSGYQSGDPVEVEVVRVSEEDRKIELSVRKIEREVGGHKTGIKDVKTNLGDLIRKETGDKR